MGRLYAGSDDGYIYCIEITVGKVVWKVRICKSQRKIPGNGRLISVSPVRTGLVVDGGAVYGCAGIFPEAGVALCALKTDDGATIWNKPLMDISPQGYMLASQTKLYAPTGRANPVVFDMGDGSFLGALGGPAGAFALLTGDSVAFGPGSTGEIGMADPETNETIATFEGLRMVVRERMSYLQTETAIIAVDRIHRLEQARRLNELRKSQEQISQKLKGGVGPAEAINLTAKLNSLKGTAAKVEAGMKQSVMWNIPCSHNNELIMAGELLFAGGDGEVAAYSAKDGSLVWKGPAEGRAYGLTVASGRLFVSTDQGVIHCYRPEKK